MKHKPFSPQSPIHSFVSTPFRVRAMWWYPLFSLMLSYCQFWLGVWCHDIVMLGAKSLIDWDHIVRKKRILFDKDGLRPGHKRTLYPASGNISGPPHFMSKLQACNRPFVWCSPRKIYKLLPIFVFKENRILILSFSELQFRAQSEDSIPPSHLWLFPCLSTGEGLNKMSEAGASKIPLETAQHAVQFNSLQCLLYNIQNV